MALNPIPAAFVCILGYIVQGLVIGSGQVDVFFPNFDPDTGGNFWSDFWGTVTEAFDFIGDILVFLGQFLVFEPVGMPWFIGIPIAVACSGSILWAGFELARGT